MAANIEIKAHARDLGALLERARALGVSETRIDQHDVFFRVPSGRLKLRILAPDRGELIHYERPDTPGPKACEYSIVQTAEPGALRQVLADALGVLGEVRKTRRLFLVGQTRVHLDDVEGLGAFLELEVVLRPGQSADEGAAIARDLMVRLGVDEGDLVSGAYLDLLLAGTCAVQTHRRRFLWPTRRVDRSQRWQMPGRARTLMTRSPGIWLLASLAMTAYGIGFTLVDLVDSSSYPFSYTVGADLCLASCVVLLVLWRGLGWPGRALASVLAVVNVVQVLSVVWYFVHGGRGPLL